MKWIKVEDKLPKEYEYVLAYPCNSASGKTVHEVCFDGKHFYTYKDQWCHCEHLQRFITHWMPLPKPPKE